MHKKVYCLLEGHRLNSASYPRECRIQLNHSHYVSHENINNGAIIVQHNMMSAYFKVISLIIEYHQRCLNELDVFLVFSAMTQSIIFDCIICPFVILALRTSSSPFDWCFSTFHLWTYKVHLENDKHFLPRTIVHKSLANTLLSCRNEQQWRDIRCQEHLIMNWFSVVPSTPASQNKACWGDNTSLN